MLSLETIALLKEKVNLHNTTIGNRIQILSDKNFGKKFTSDQIEWLYKKYPKLKINFHEAIKRNYPTRVGYAINYFIKREDRGKGARVELLWPNFGVLTVDSFLLELPDENIPKDHEIVLCDKLGFRLEKNDFIVFFQNDEMVFAHIEELHFSKSIRIKMIQKNPKPAILWVSNTRKLLKIHDGITDQLMKLKAANNG